MDDHEVDGDRSRAEAVAELMAQHGAARYADVETIAACLPSLPRPPADGETPLRP